MQSPLNFIITPKNGQYVNYKEIGGKKLCVNTSIEEAKDVNRIAIVLNVPMHYEGEVQVGDEVVIHHNIFRITYNSDGEPLQSHNYIKDNLWYCKDSSIFMAIRDGKKFGVHDNVFVQPLKNDDIWSLEAEKKHIGKIIYTNENLSKQGLNNGDLVAFMSESEYEFNIDNEKLYKMTNKQVLAKLV